MRARVRTVVLLVLAFSGSSGVWDRFHVPYIYIILSEFSPQVHDLLCQTDLLQRLEQTMSLLSLIHEHSQWQTGGRKRD